MLNGATVAPSTIVCGNSATLRWFAEWPDPRMNRTRRHRLGDVLALALCAVICGADGWVPVADFGRCKRQWFAFNLS